MKRARIFSRVGETRGAEFEIDAEATLGRHPDNQVVLSPSLISSRHARIYFDPSDNCYVLEDLDSLNGTALDGRKVRGRERLGHLHVITFAGRHDFIFQDRQRCVARHAEGTVPVRKQPTKGVEVDGSELSGERTGVEDMPVFVPEALARSVAGEGGGDAELPGEKTDVEDLPVAMPGTLAGKGRDVVEESPPPKPHPMPETLDSIEVPASADGTRLEKMPLTIPDLLAKAVEETGPVKKVAFYLELLGSEDRIERARLREGENVLGRGVDAHIQPENPDISRRHAVLTVRGHNVTIRDEGSRNHTFVDGEEIASDVEIKPGTRLRFGKLEARLVVLDRE